MASPYPGWIDDYGAALRTSLVTHDMQSHMPFNGWNFFPLLAEYWVQRVSAAVTTIRDNGVDLEKRLVELPGHAPMKASFAFMVFALYRSSAPREVARPIVDFFVEVIRRQTHGEPLWLNNEIKALVPFAESLTPETLSPGNREVASELGKIIMGCATLGHGLYSDFFPDTSYDVYGPYTLPNFADGSILVVRAFDDLNPTELWRTHTPFPFKSVRVSGVYQGLSLEPTYVACQTLTSGSALDTLTHWKVDVDGENVTTLERLKEIRNSLLAAASALYVEYQEMGEEKQKELWISQCLYEQKGIFDLAGMDWRPDPQVAVDIAKKELLSDLSTYNLSEDEFDKQFGISYLRQIYS